MVDENGKTLQALAVFTLVIESLKSILHKFYDSMYIEEKEFYYVFIVPEIFQQIGAIDFMRKAALEVRFQFEINYIKL